MLVLGTPKNLFLPPFLSFSICDYRLENTTTNTVSCIFVSLAIHASSISLYSLGFLGIAIIFMEWIKTTNIFIYM